MTFQARLYYMPGTESIKCAKVCCQHTFLLKRNDIIILMNERKMEEESQSYPDNGKNHRI